MAGRLKAIVFKRFHSVLSERVDLSNPTLFVGWNGSGKSNLADAFAFLSEIAESPLQTAVEKRGGIHSLITRRPGERLRAQTGRWFLVSDKEVLDPTLGMRVEFDQVPAMEGELQSGHFAFELQLMSRYTYKVIREQCLIRGRSDSSWYDRKEDVFGTNMDWFKGFSPKFVSPAGLLLQTIGGIFPLVFLQQFLKAMSVYSIDPGQLRNMQDPDIGTSLRSDGRNATSVLAEILEESPDDGRRIFEILATVSPGLKRIVRVRQGRQLSLKFFQEWGENKRLDFDAFSMSDGTLRALGLILAVYQRQRPSVMVIEEPEASIHPAALGVILDVLRHASRRMQVVITTHSPEVLDAKWVREDTLRMVVLEDGVTRVSGLSEFSLRALRDHLMGAGELLRSNSLEPQTRPLFDHLDTRQVSLFE